MQQPKRTKYRKMFKGTNTGLAHRGSIRQRHDIRPRSHHFSNSRVAEFNNRLNQLTFFFLQNSFGFTYINQCLKIASIIIILFFETIFENLIFSF